MRIQARRFTEQWLSEHAAEPANELVSVKEIADKLVRDAQGIPSEDFEDDHGRLLKMIIEVVDQR